MFHGGMSSLVLEGSCLCCLKIESCVQLGGSEVTRVCVLIAKAADQLLCNVFSAPSHDRSKQIISEQQSSLSHLLRNFEDFTTAAVLSFWWWAARTSIQLDINQHLVDM